MAEPIYANYVEYYEDIRKRMIRDQVYHVENYMVIKRQYDEKPFGHSISVDHGNHKTTTVLHPKEASKYIQLAPNNANEKDNVWSCREILGEYLNVKSGKKYNLLHSKKVSW